LALFAPIALAVIGIVLLVLVSPVLGAVVLVLGLGVVVANALLGSPTRLLANVGGALVVAAAEPRLVNLVEGLCVANGLTVPELRVLEDRAPNAIVLGAKADHAVLILTRGLLDLLDRIELEAVVAHELAHVKRGDLEIAQRATVAAGLAVHVLPSVGLAVLRLGDGGREALADGAAAIMTRYPPGLGAALAKLAGAPTTRPSGLSPTTARLTAARWCAPLAEAEQDRVVAGVLDLELRVAALAER
jgi:Zn-dependent protease with chaperone function